MSELKRLKKDILVFSTLLVVCLAGIYGFYTMYDYGKNRTHKETRHARMIDVFDRHSHYKGHDYYYTYGYFIDYKSGAHFVSPVTELTFKTFKKDDNKPVETSWAYSLDEMEQTSKGMVAQSVGLFFVIFFIFFGIFNLSQIILLSHRKKELSYQQTILNKESP